MKAPNEVVAPAFKKGISGYSIAEVDEYVEGMLNSYNELYKAFEDTEEKLRVIVEAYSELKAKEETVDARIAEAKEISEALVTQAQAEYEKTIAEAQTRADEINAAMSASCKETLATYSAMYEEEKQRLVDIEKKAQEFRSSLLGAYKKQLSLLCNSIPSNENETMEQKLPTTDEFKSEATAGFKEKVSKASDKSEDTVNA